jgi:hypothetical protein
MKFAHNRGAKQYYMDESIRLEEEIYTMVEEEVLRRDPDPAPTSVASNSGDTANPSAAGNTDSRNDR